MTFLDNAGKAGQQVVQIKENMADTDRLNAEIAEVEKTIDTFRRLE